MTGFTRGQIVYISEQPETGPWRYFGLTGDAGTATLMGLWTDEIRELLPSCGAFEHQPLLPGLKVKYVPGHEELSGVIRRLEGHEEYLRVLHIELEDGRQLEVLESEIEPLPPANEDPLEWLRAAIWRGPWRFFCRQEIQNSLGQWHEDSEGIPGLLGARIKAMGHQIYAARRILWDREPRFILADEVGLGKTVEAGLVIQALTANKPEMRVLVIAPGSMTRQWLCELYLKFGGRPFVLVENTQDEVKLAHDQERISTQSKVIVSATALVNHEATRHAVESSHWDMVVVDEAHQFPPHHLLYPMLHRLADRSKGFLVLSATPSKRELSGLLGLLSLVAPDVYSPGNHEELEKQIKQKKEVWDVLRYTDQLLGSGDDKMAILDAVADEWEETLEDDPIVEAFIERLRNGDQDALEELVAYVQEFHSLDHRLIRTRRLTLSAIDISWSQRVGMRIEYDPSPEEVLFLDRLDSPPAAMTEHAEGRALIALLNRYAWTTPQYVLNALEMRLSVLGTSTQSQVASSLVTALQSDPGPGEEPQLLKDLIAFVPESPGERSWLESLIVFAREWAQKENPGARLSAAADWINSFLQADPTRKLLVFTQETAIVRDFAQHLRETLDHPNVAEFCFGMNPEELSEAALRFQQPASCNILISDELGGEGRNFQHATAVMHLDVPWSVSRIEQRIGRLDRLGRDEGLDVQSITLTGPAESEQVLANIHQEIFGVFKRTVGGLEFVLPEMQRRVFDALGRNVSTLRALSEELRQEVEEALNNTDDEFELALDTARPELERAIEVAEIIEESSEGDGESWFKALRGWSRLVGVNMQTRSDTVEINWDNSNMSAPLEGFGEGKHHLTGTFDRQQALNEENLQYFAPGHRAIDAIVSKLDSSHEGKLTVFQRNLGIRHRGKLFAIVMVKCALDSKRLEGAAISSGLLTRVRSILWPQCRTQFLQLHINEEPAASIVDDLELKNALENDYKGKKKEPKVYPTDLVKLASLEDILAATTTATDMALKVIREERHPEAEEAATDLEDNLAQHRGYLTWKLANSQDRAKRAECIDELNGIRTVIDAVRHEIATVDAVAIVVGA